MVLAQSLEHRGNEASSRWTCASGLVGAPGGRGEADPGRWPGPGSSRLTPAGAPASGSPPVGDDPFRRFPDISQFASTPRGVRGEVVQHEESRVPRDGVFQALLPIASFAVSQCPGVAALPAGVGGLGRNRPPSGRCVCLRGKPPQQKYRAAWPRPYGFHRFAAEPPSFLLPPANRPAPWDPARTAPGAMGRGPGRA